jgi:hypothetical protein
MAGRKQKFEQRFRGRTTDWYSYCNRIPLEIREFYADVVERHNMYVLWIFITFIEYFFSQTNISTYLAKYAQKLI